MSSVNNEKLLLLADSSDLSLLLVYHCKAAFKQSALYICSNIQKYTVWVKIIDFYFMPKIIRILSKDDVP